MNPTRSLLGMAVLATVLAASEAAASPEPAVIAGDTIPVHPLASETALTPGTTVVTQDTIPGDLAPQDDRDPDHPDRKRYPHEGYLDYNGTSHMWSDFWWHSAPGGWVSGDPALELDISTTLYDYFESCTSWTNMPYAYSDCTTAGWTETGDKSYGIGTYRPEQMIGNVMYSAEWNFSGGQGASSGFQLNWQEVAKKLCSMDSPWCMLGACDPGCGGYLLRDTLYYTGQIRTYYWYY